MRGIAAVVAAGLAAGGAFASPALGTREIAAAVAEELTNEIRPGGVAQPGFWNENSTRFMYPPSLRFMEVPGAAKYRFSVVDACGTLVSIESPDPVARLRPQWTNLVAGIVNVVCEAQDGKGVRVGLVQDRFFYKKAPFAGGYPPPVRRAGEAAKAAYAHLAAMPQIRHLAEKGEPDRTYMLNGYTTKMNAAIVLAMVHYAKLDPARAPEALKVARAAADHLIAGAAKPGTPLAGFTLTYEAGYGNGICDKYAGQSMNLYPAASGNAFLRLYEATKDAAYLAAAVRIGETYLRLQGEDGTWFLKQRFADGGEVNPNRLFPLTTMGFLEDLYAETKRAEFRAAADRAAAFIERGPVADWNWEGQFEDVEPEPRYTNLTKHPATDFALFCLKRHPGDAKRVALAREILRFAEDQFVEWERPFQGCRLPPPVWGVYARDFWHDKRAPIEEAVYPAVLEQYRCYVPVDASSAKMIRTYLALYRAEGKALDLAKARALADALTRAQRADGSIPTWMIPGRSPGDDWVNCLIASANALEEMSAFE